VGVAIASIGLLLLVYPLVEGQVVGWPAWTFISIGLSPLVLTLFILYERLLPPSRFPLVQLSMFRIPSFRVGVIISALFIGGIPAFFFTFSLMLQVGLGFSALHAGLTTIPWSVGAAFASAMSTRVAPRLGKWTIASGSGLLVAGILGIILTLHFAGTTVTSIDLIPSFLASGLGLGTVIAPLLRVILAGVPGRDAGSASGVLATFQQLGGALGLAVIGVAFFGLLSSGAPIALAGVAPQLRSDLAAVHLPPDQVDGAVAKFTGCFEKQMSSSDLNGFIPGCPSTTHPSSDPVSRALANAAQRALSLDFVSSLKRILFFNVGIWFVVGLLSFLLPNAPVSPTAEPGAAA
jgi:hypothetical protein